MDKSVAFHYRDRAESFLLLAQIAMDPEVVEGWYRRQLSDLEDGVGLLAVHSAIAFSDAGLVWLTGDRSKDQNHAAAAAMLRQACGKKGTTADGVTHFERLVRKKNYFSYDDRRVRAVDIKAAMLQLIRFRGWLYEAIPELKGEQ